MRPEGALIHRHVKLAPLVEYAFDYAPMGQKNLAQSNALGINADAIYAPQGQKRLCRVHLEHRRLSPD